MIENPGTDAPKPSQTATFVALGAAVAASILLPGQPPGLNVVLVSMLASIAVLIGLGRDLDRFDLLFGVSGFLLIMQFVFKTADWVLLLDVMAALALATICVSGPRTWMHVLETGARAFAKLPRGLALALTPIAFLFRGMSARTAVIVRGVIFGLGLVLLFGSLFASADQAFASIARTSLIPDFDLALLPARIVVGAAVAGATGSLILLSRIPITDFGAWRAFGPDPSERKKFEVVEWLPGILLLDLLFVFFVAVQVHVLFGRNDHVLTTEGLTYAEYARQGFFQLLTTVGLTVLVIAVVVHLADLVERRARRLAQIGLGLLSALTLVVLTSAYYRLNLYEEAYGFTRLRLLVHASILWFAVLLVLIAIAGALWRADWFPRAILLVTAIGLLGFNGISPDAFIARRNIERFHATGRIDIGYLSTLSSDAVPALMELEDPQRGCVFGRGAFDARRGLSFWAFNFSSRKAKELVATVPVHNGGC